MNLLLPIGFVSLNLGKRHKPSFKTSLQALFICNEETIQIRASKTWSSIPWRSTSYYFRHVEAIEAASEGQISNNQRHTWVHTDPSCVGQVQERKAETAASWSRQGCSSKALNDATNDFKGLYQALKLHLHSLQLFLGGSRHVLLLLGKALLHRFELVVPRGLECLPLSLQHKELVLQICQKARDVFGRVCLLCGLFEFLHICQDDLVLL